LSCLAHESRSLCRPLGRALGVHRVRPPPEVITLAVRWYLRFGLSYRDVEKLLAERGVEVDHVSIFRWAQRFTPLLAQAARPCQGPLVGG
jgi:transposase, IS6 family